MKNEREKIVKNLQKVAKMSINEDAIDPD